MQQRKTMVEEAAEIRRTWLHFLKVLDRETGFTRFMDWLERKLSRR